MWSWWTWIFENDDSLDFIGGIYEEHKENNWKDNFLLKSIKWELKEISTSQFLNQEESIWIEVSAYIFSELINYDEERIKQSLKELEQELQSECRYKLDLSKPIFQIIDEVEEKEWFIPTEMYLDLCLYKNKDYNIWEIFLYRLLRQLYNILSWRSENYVEWWDGDMNDSEFKKWFNWNKKIFNILKKWLKKEDNIKKIWGKIEKIWLETKKIKEKLKKNSYTNKIKNRLEKINELKNKKENKIITEEDYLNQLKNINLKIKKWK